MSALTPLEALAVPPPFDLSATLESGQTFHWHRSGSGWTGMIGDTPVHVEQTAPDLLHCTPGTGDLVRHYFALDHDIAAITGSFPAGDVALAAAVAWCPGLRILRQPRWECLATFITSSLKQVPHIRRISLTLRERFGCRVTLPGQPDQWTYPTPEALAAAGEDALRACGLGYRAAFLHRSAHAITSGALDLEATAGLSDDDARAALCTLHGVGEKVANCALLFAWERLGAFPIDVWVERVILRLYFPRRRKLSAAQLRDFARKHFGPHRGYAQQFLFHHARLGASTASPPAPEPKPQRPRQQKRKS